MELNETHGAAIQKKARYEVGHGFDLLPHRGVDAEEASEEQYDTLSDFWFGTDSTRQGLHRQRTKRRSVIWRLLSSI